MEAPAAEKSLLRTPPAPGLLSRIDWSADATLAQTAMVCIVAAFLSTLLTGFVFGVWNNLFHLPIIEGLYDERQFRDDAFIQSLRSFASGIWIVLSRFPNAFGDGQLLFLVLAYLSRLLAFVGLVCCASLVGIKSLRERTCFCLVIGFIVFLRENSYAGQGGLFLYYFTHSEVANGTLLLAIFFALKGRIAAALAWSGATFFINAFMGIWLALPILFIAAALLAQRKIALRSLIVQTALGGICFALLAAPVLYNIFSNPEFGGPIDFDYQTYLREYYPAHSLFDTNSSVDILLLISVALLGWACFTALARTAVEFKAALAGAISLYLIGIAVPLVTASPTILNLNLLRSGAMFHLLAAVGAGALAAKWLTGKDAQRSTILGPYLLFCLCATKYLLPVAAALVLFARPILAIRGTTPDARLRRVIVASLVLIVWPWQTWQAAKLNMALRDAVEDWRAVGAWARSATPADSVFLILTTGPGIQGSSDADTQRAEELSAAASVFEASSHRRVWVDFKRGAAVMWRPSYYRQWRSRIAEVLALRNLPERLDYARRHRLSHVIDDCRAVDATDIQPVFRHGRLCVAAL